MAWKRPGTRSNASTLGKPSSSRPRATPAQSSARSRHSSVRSNQPAISSPALPQLSQRSRLSLREAVANSRNAAASDVDSDAPGWEEDEADILAREEYDSVNEIVMAIDVQKRDAFGCAYYNAREEKLFLMQDSNLTTMEIIATLNLHAQPTIVLIRKNSGELEAYLRKDAREIDRGEGDNGIFGLYELQSCASSDFSYELGEQTLVNLDIFTADERSIHFLTPNDCLNGIGSDDIQGGHGLQARLLKLAGCADLESRITIGCAGAILSHLARRKAAEFLPQDEAAQGAFRVKNIEMFTLPDIMFVNADTLASLQIIGAESHPNSYMQGPDTSATGSKESLSVFGLFYHLAHTPQGKLRLRQMFLRPSTDLAVLQERFQTIDVFLRPENSQILKTISKCLSKIKDMRSIIIRLRRGFGSTKGPSYQGGHWATLQQFSAKVMIIRENLQAMTSRVSLPLIEKLLEAVQPNILYNIGRSIEETIDFEMSREQHRPAVRQGVDSKLDDCKRAYDGLGSLLRVVAQRVLEGIPEWAHKYIQNCIFYPQLGFLTVVSIDNATGTAHYRGEGLEDDVWERYFLSNDVGYFKNRQMRDLDHHYGDIYGEICDREIEIIHSLAVKILDHEDMLALTSVICGELDSLLALALGAQKYNYTQPQMTSANVIRIEGGRHPLQELTVPAYVANGCYLSGGPGEDGLNNEATDQWLGSNSTPEFGEGPSMLIMTGPNYSGKSVYLKQVALIVYMAHIGSFVPALRATVGLTDRILTRITTRESVSRNQSAFMIDLQQVALATSLATHRSLIVVDEFGKGTNAADGAGLACGLFEYFLGLGPCRPKVLGATHFHEIFENGFMPERPSLSFAHMEVHVDKDVSAVEDQITFLYNFVPGRSSSSYGICCAALNGIDDAVIQRTHKLILSAARGEDLVSICAEVSRQELRILERAERIGRAFLEQEIPQSSDKTQSTFDVRVMLQEVLSSR
ncbi:hypothetical protein BP6252_09839 [Coleophoma cylindrospora]|uniref:DNA mismatch repair protein MSH5 n=1 Tax=Coleophoma cylindrospora TaxID=1849047 RepID=A0A3D8QXD8_9HELO|nr:hypothetical protein BP6252_09839 [Coleophoma cylindrospora]